MYVTKEQIAQARNACLYSFLASYHSDSFRREGDSLRMVSRHGISVKKDTSCYQDFCTGEKGNSIDMLTNVLGYSFVDAVVALNGAGSCSAKSPPETPPQEVIPPERADNNNAVRKYLQSRGILDACIIMLVDLGVLYQSTWMQNAVFLSPDRRFFELRGINPSIPFHRCKKWTPDCYWWFSADNNPEVAYICESAIDAVSLFQLHMCKNEGRKPAAYCSIAGVANQKAIDSIAKRYTPILAVDNDAAGEKCISRNPGMDCIVPSLKDWNEDLQVYMKSLSSDVGISG